MARARRASDDVYNARRRIRRAAKAADRRGEEERARQLRRLAEETYIGRGLSANVQRAASAALAALRALPTSAQRREAQERNRQIVAALRAAQRTPSPRQGATDLARAIRARRAERVGRDNEIFSREINLASQDLPSSIDRADLSGKSQARIFWMSTRKLWMGAPPDQRYEAIMRALWTDSLREAFERVLEYNERAVSMAEEAEREVRDTLAEMGDERGDEPVSIGSPPEFMYFVRDYSAQVNLMR